MFGRHIVSAFHTSTSAGAASSRAGRQRAGLGVLVLAAFAVLAQALDMAAGARVAAQHAAAAINPLTQVSFALGGAAGSAGIKLAVTIAAAVLFVELARSGRAQLAQTFLMLSAAMGLLGFIAKVL